jgi:energy-coupling factor transporter ATP-binding protein EcfA2
MHATPATAQFKTIPQARKAERRQVKLKLGVQGPSGSGKTKGALYLATLLWPEAKILLVDTENESASLYANEFNFDTIPLDPPFESQRYEACIDYAVENSYDVLILDSVTHQWDGEGGILRRKEELDRRPGSNSFTNWATFTPEHTHFIESIKQAPIHIIATMRSKQDYVLQENDKGKSKPVKMGMAPVQRDGFDYEFTLIFDVQMDHKATVVKNRTGLFEGKVVNLGDEKVAKQIRTWLDSGKPIEAPKPAAPIAVPTPKATAKVAEWKLDGDHLHCFVYDVQRRTSKKGSEFMAVKHNGQVNGKDIVFCFEEHLFEALASAKDKHCVFFIEAGEYTNVHDIAEVDGAEYRNGKPYTAPPQQTTIPIGDNDIPF